MTYCTIANLDPNQTYFFAVTAYAEGSNSSPFSAELVWDNVPPRILPSATPQVFTPAETTVLLPDLLTPDVLQDDVTPHERLHRTQIPAVRTELGAGVTIVTLTARDESGNTTSTQVAVHVTSPPQCIEELPAEWVNRYPALDQDCVELDDDCDGDGLTNVEEYITGCDPSIGDAPPFIRGVSGNGTTGLGFVTRDAEGPGYDGLQRIYCLESTADLRAGPWLPIPALSRIVGAGQTVSIPPHGPGGVTCYRLRIWLE